MILMIKMGQAPSIKDRIRSERSDIKRKERVLDREIALMNYELQKCVRELKKEVKNNNLTNATFISKNYAMIKKNITNLYKMKNQISSLCLQMQMMGSQEEIHEAMARVTHTMKILNARMNLSSVKSIIKDFENEKLKNEITGEMLDTMNDIDEEDEETEAEILNRVCDELHISIANVMKEPPSDTVFVSSRTNDESIRKLEERLGNIGNF
jgi:5'-3' exonuclease